jgi:signal transduction histidine kinase/CheY-like chemotaxis protein
MGTPAEPPDAAVGTRIDQDDRRAEWLGSESTRPALVDRTPTERVTAKILVVEDEHLVALDLELRLGRMGHAVVVSHSGEEAVETCARSPFDLVLMDIKLRGPIDGIEAARQIRHAYDIPIIYLTAYADNHTLERARFTEPYGYILKPFQERELKAAIEMALQRHAQDKARSEQQRLQRFLAEVSARMATSLDYRAVARGTAELVVPRYADWCLIHLREIEDTIPAFACSTPAGIEGPWTSARVIERVERDARAELVTQIADVDALRDAIGPQHVDVLRELGARSLACVPLVARDQVLGSLTLASGRTRVQYGEPDLAFIEDLGRRLAIALDNALLYRKAERALIMRDDVLAIVSHDLRAPLSTILLQAEILAKQPELDKAAHTIDRAAHRMDRLIGDLLDASAINAGHLMLDVALHRAEDLVREAVEPFRAKAEEGAIMLEGIAAPDLGELRCDRDRILQMLSNLVDNALRFTPPGGRISVHATRRGREAIFEVEDTGPGIAPELLPHLFDRFWRGRARRGGAGLGLFIAKGIAAAHGSTLEVDSTLGRGTTFRFRLPRAG